MLSCSGGIGEVGFDSIDSLGDFSCSGFWSGVGLGFLGGFEGGFWVVFGGGF